jgi:hypothetical protein
MKKPTTKYSKGEIGRVTVVEDFLPPPERLVLRIYLEPQSDSKWN